MEDQAIVPKDFDESIFAPTGNLLATTLLIVSCPGADEEMNEAGGGQGDEAKDEDAEFEIFEAESDNEAFGEEEAADEEDADDDDEGGDEGNDMMDDSEEEEEDYEE